MPDRISALILVGLIGGSLLISLTLFGSIVGSVIVAFCAGVALALSLDHSFVQLWRRSPTVWRVFGCIFVVMAMVLPPPGEHFFGRLFLGMLAISGVLLLLSIVHLILGERLGLDD
jgi:hypothetical protein